MQHATTTILVIKKIQWKTWIMHFLKKIKKCHQFSHVFKSLLISQPKFIWFSKNMSGLESTWNLLSNATFCNFLPLFNKKLWGKTRIIHFLMMNEEISQVLDRYHPKILKSSSSKARLRGCKLSLISSEVIPNIDGWTSCQKASWGKQFPYPASVMLWTLRG